jgi:hypothetical protein
MTHFNGLVAGIAAMLAAVISLLTYLDDSGKLAVGGLRPRRP